MRPIEFVRISKPSLFFLMAISVFLLILNEGQFHLKTGLDYTKIEKVK